MKKNFCLLNTILCLFFFPSIYGAFTPPETISEAFISPEFNEAPILAQDPAGNIIGVWAAGVPGNLKALVTAKHAPLGNWETPFIATPPAVFLEEYDITIDNAGNAYLIWTTGLSFSGVSLFTSFLPFGSETWTVPVLLATNLNITSPKIAASVPGHAVATWEESVSVNDSIQFGSVFMGGIWTPPVAISNPAQKALNGQLAIDGLGNALIIWQGDQTNIQVVQLLANVWSPPQIISNPANGASFPQISMNGVGQAVAVWQKNISSSSVVIDSAIFFNGLWTAPVSITSPALQSTNPAIGIDELGNAVATWQLALGGGMNAIEAAYLKGGFWSVPQQISTNGDNSSDPTVSVNSSGRASIVWIGTAPTAFGISEVSLFNGATFSTPVILSSPTLNSILQTTLIDNLGNVVVVWQSIDFGTLDFIIQSSQTDNLFAPFSPFDFQGVVKKNSFLSQTDLIHQLTWKPPFDPTIAGYVLYRNGVFLSLVPATGPFLFLDHDRSKRIVDTYTLFSFTSGGLISTPVIISVPD